ncbi:SNF2 family N-terminal domain-containing protein [Jimgerdemannia flammicorona]|uniref:SNF2 family N-terminal domain-containing protein n=1 Tax=Jimgerdemannia flammicorona TaxID=994334 RepID=A0A433Q959_9FUNG|nr:SNF2 family N-terminal domain-containing protein [Jimgerdemannia flammicorona]
MYSDEEHTPPARRPTTSGVYGGLYPSTKPNRDLEYHPRNDLASSSRDSSIQKSSNDWEIRVKFKTEPTTPLDNSPYRLQQNPPMSSLAAESADSALPPPRRHRRLVQKNHDEDSPTSPEPEPDAVRLPELERRPERKPERERESRPEREPERKPERNPKRKPELKTDREPELKIQQESERKPKRDSKPKPEHKSDRKTERESDPYEVHVKSEPTEQTTTFVPKARKDLTHSGDQDRKSAASLFIPKPKRDHTPKEDRQPPPVTAAPQVKKEVVSDPASTLLRKPGQRVDPLERDRSPPELHHPSSPSWRKPQTLEARRGFHDSYTAQQPPPPPFNYYTSDRDSALNTLSSSSLASGYGSPASRPRTSRKIQSDLAELLQTIPSQVDDVESTIEQPEQLTVTLMKHQIKGLVWMIDREEKAMGGILADTIQTMSLILAKRPAAGEPKTTLIVAPLALIRQWENEIISKTLPKSLTIYVHHGPNRTKDAKKLQRYDVVITTYQVVASEWPKTERKKKDESAKAKTKAKAGDDNSDSFDSDDANNKPLKAKATKGPLFHTKFYRAVLDEAQTIKNKSAKSSIACSNLDSTKRWCLTGTPIQNNVDELYSLFKFLRLKLYSEYPVFKEHFTRPLQQGRSQQMVHALQRLQVILKAIMLRRTKTTLIDGKPLLDLPARNVIAVTPDFTEEERQFYTALEERTKTTFSKLAKAGPNHNYMSMLLLLLRLRQACNHPVLVQKSFTDDPDAVEVPAQNPDEEENVSEVMKMMNNIGIGMGKGGREKFCSLCLETLRSDEVQYCYACTNEFDLSTDANGDGEVPVVKRSPLDFKFSTSTKIDKMIEILDETRRQDNTAKTIVFSQFTSMLNLVEGPLKKNGHKFVRYDGSMLNKLREESLDKLRNDPSVTVLLLSLKCGSLGLNLTCANNVILLDIWWNPAVEGKHDL